MKNLLIKENYTSENLFNKMGLLSEEQIRDIDKGLDWTTKYYPNAVLIGGTALINYLKSGRDLTPDIDFLVSDIEQIKDHLDENDILFKPLRDYENSVIGITVPEFNTDYLDVNGYNPALNKLIISAPNATNIGGYNIKIIAPELLTIMKLELSRDKDVKDAFALIQSGVLDRDKYVKFANMLKNNLNDYESIVSYSGMIM